MSEYVIQHRHEPSECAAVYASFQGFATPLRRRRAASSCGHGGHAIWWFVEAETAALALAQVPAFVAGRSVVTPIEHVRIP